ncbi:MAG TPA: SusC/RagA family TonB-linked outer membrane protein [Gemmatimonadaceae bacterium]
MRRRTGLTLALLLGVVIAPAARAQTRNLTGRVYDDATQQGVPGALVSVVNGTIVSQAGPDGRYRITLPTTAVKLLFRGLGYKRQEVDVDASKTTLDVPLAKEALQLNEVVVTGTATTQERRNISTAVASVTGDQVNQAPSASLENALQGKIVGATINMNSGAPGGGGQIQIRGVTSILGNGQPLFVVDGVIFDNSASGPGINAVTRASGSGATSSQDNPVNRLADLNPDEIENIQILKSAAASAIYGSQATNGVVLITTKRGRGGNTQFHLTQRLGTNTADRLLGSRRFQSQADLAKVTGATVAAADCPTSPCPYYDYQGELYGNKGLAYETALSISGGTDVTKYFVSANDKSDPGTMINTDARRQNIRLNIDQALGSKFTTSASAAIYRSGTARGISNNDNTFTSPVYAFGYTPAVIDLRAINPTTGKPIDNLLLKQIVSTGSNPFQTIEGVKDFEDTWRQVASGTARWAAWSAQNQTFAITATGGFDRYDSDGETYAPNYLQFEPDDGLPGTGVQAEVLSRLFNGSLNAVHTYTPTQNRFLPGITSLTSAVGLQYEDRANNTYSVVARGLLPGIQEINQGTPTIAQNKTIVRNEAAYASEELLAFNDKFSASAHVRAEKSSVNGDRDKVFYWPAVSASYRFTNLIPHADEIKLRASYGVSGNQPLYGLRDLVLVPNGLIDGRNAVAEPTTLGNTNIEPEKMHEAEIGIDGSFYNNRVGLEASYYNRRITDMLLQPSLAPSSGFGNEYINGGVMNTAGLELAVTLLPIQSRNFSWTSRTQYYTNATRIVSLPPSVADFIIASSGFGAQYGRGHIARGQIATMIWGNVPQPGGGSADVPIADANPKFQMGFSNDFQIRGLTINTLLDWRYKGYVSDMTQNLFDEGQNSWDYDKPSPNPAVGATLGAYRYNTWNGGANAGQYIQDGSFLKLREITLTYPLPARLTNRVLHSAHEARLSFSGRNLFTWTKYWSFDPEVNNFGNQNVVRFVDLAPFPPSRNFLFGIDVGF